MEPQLRDVKVVHNVNPDGEGVERVYMALDRLIPDQPRLRRNYPSGSALLDYDLGPEDEKYGLMDDRRYPKAHFKTVGQVYRLEAHVTHDENDYIGSDEPLTRTKILVVEGNTREPDQVVITSSVLSESDIREALKGVA